MSNDFLPFHRPSIGAAERDAVLGVLESGWLTTGPCVAALERAFSEFVGAAHAVALNSATAALHLALEALEVGEDDEVVVPTYTFAASSEVVLYRDARPVLVDVDEETLNLDITAAARATTDRTKAVEVVHVAGLPAPVAELRAAVTERTPVVEDTAHAFPSRASAAGGRMAGTLGRVGAYSFYATKTITTGEGGMLVTDDEALAARARQMSLHGISRDAWKRYTAAGSWYYEIEAAGFKYNMTDIAAALGLAQLKRADELRTARAEIAGAYREGLEPLAARGLLRLPSPGVGDEHAWHLFIVRLTQDGARAVGDEVDTELPGVAGLPDELRPLASARARAIDRLRSAGIGTSVHFIPLHLHPLYRSRGYAPGDFPRAEAAYAGAISLPIWPGMTPGDIHRVTDAVSSIVAGSGR